MIAHGLPIFMALEPVGMRFRFELLGGLVCEKMQTEPRTLLNLAHENELLKRRIYGNKTERTQT